VANVDVIADMSTTLVDLLTPALTSLPCEVRLSNTDEYKTFAPMTPTVTIFLYHVAINGELRNTAPRTLGDGTIARPFLPIELRYLITLWTSQPITSHRILGHVMRRLAAFQTMERKHLSGESWDDDDTVQLIPQNLAVDEYHDIWDPAEIPYKLSISYLARVIGLDPADPDAFPVVISASFIGPPDPGAP
jgi:hypothetical protein